MSAREHGGTTGGPVSVAKGRVSRRVGGGWKGDYGRVDGIFIEVIWICRSGRIVRGAADDGVGREWDAG